MTAAGMMLVGFNPLEKYESNWIISPSFGVKIKKCLSCHHLAYIRFYSSCFEGFGTWGFFIGKFSWITPPGGLLLGGSSQSHTVHGTGIFIYLWLLLMDKYIVNVVGKYSVHGFSRELVSG